MRAVETTPAASLNAGEGEELSSGLVRREQLGIHQALPVWPVSRFTCPWPSSPTVDAFHSKLKEQNIPVSLTDNVFPFSGELSDCKTQGQAMIPQFASPLSK